MTHSLSYCKGRNYFFYVYYSQHGKHASNGSVEFEEVGLIRSMVCGSIFEKIDEVSL
jgi:hypothetical protein